MSQDTKDFVAAEMRANVDAFLDAVEDANTEAKRVIGEAARAFDERHQKLVRQLLSSPAVPVPAPGGTVPNLTVARPTELPIARPAKATERRPARSVILALLAQAEGPVYAKVLDEAVAAEGWTKSASDKIKQRLRSERLVSIDKRLWTLTSAGRAAASSV